eukprot:NODE_3258_length_2065_cov_3.578431.p1 GENE.NODE_3258_length_2065_cov_3.578431~~NODE_3258_length_2065_cov_3.578431.p1  ORF type:complete len:417 (+),score=102.50 NODE_3258_length_2065_cov_3.578431:102-1352(+)
MDSTSESEDASSWAPTENEASALVQILDGVKTARWTSVKQHMVSLSSCFDCGLGADVPRLLNLADECGWTPLHFACHGGTSRHTQIITLLCQFEADVNVQDWRGWTPLHVAAQFAQPGALTQLLDSLADPGILDDTGNLPFDCASTAEKRNLLERPQIHLEQLVHRVYTQLRRKREFVWLPVSELHDAISLEDEIEQHLTLVCDEVKRLERRLEAMRALPPSRHEDALHARRSGSIEGLIKERDEAQMMHDVAQRALWRLKSQTAEDLLVSAAAESHQLLARCKDGREHEHKLLRSAAEALERAIEKGVRDWHERGEHGEEHWADPFLLREVESLTDKFNELRFACITPAEAVALEKKLMKCIVDFSGNYNLLQGSQGDRSLLGSCVRKPMNKLRGCVNKSRSCTACQSVWSRFGL